MHELQHRRCLAIILFAVLLLVTLHAPLVSAERTLPSSMAPQSSQVPTDGSESLGTDVHSPLDIDQLYKLYGRTVALRSRKNGQFATVRLNVDSTNPPLIVDSSEPHSWQRFTLVNAGVGHIALRSQANNKYVYVDITDGNRLKANQSSYSSNGTKFIAQPFFSVSGVAYALWSEGALKFVTADNAINGNPVDTLYANRTSTHVWQQFEIVDLSTQIDMFQVVRAFAQNSNTRCRVKDDSYVWRDEDYTHPVDNWKLFDRLNTVTSGGFASVDDVLIAHVPTPRPLGSGPRGEGLHYIFDHVAFSDLPPDGVKDFLGWGHTVPINQIYPNKPSNGGGWLRWWQPASSATPCQTRRSLHYTDITTDLDVGWSTVSGSKCGFLPLGPRFIYEGSVGLQTQTTYNQYKGTHWQNDYTLSASNTTHGNEILEFGVRHFGSIGQRWYIRIGGGDLQFARHDYNAWKKNSNNGNGGRVAQETYLFDLGPARGTFAPQYGLIGYERYGCPKPSNQLCTRTSELELAFREHYGDVETLGGYTVPLDYRIIEEDPSPSTFLGYDCDG